MFETREHRQTLEMIQDNFHHEEFKKNGKY